MKRLSMGMVLVMALALAGVAVADDKADKKADDKKATSKQVEKKNDKERIYGFEYEKVWNAAVKAANENFVVEHSDKENGILNFHSGMSATSNGFRCGVSLTKLDDGRTRVKINTQKKMQLFAWGAGGRISDKFFKNMEALLMPGGQ